jgi:CheY-like chemotaxis protein
MSFLCMRKYSIEGAGNMRILVVDDEAVIRDIIHRVLANRGHEIIEAANGLEALQVAHCDPHCDLVITDEVMPLLSGRELIARLATERYPARYLLISGYSLGAQVSAGLACLAKPFTIGQLIDRVDALWSEPTLRELEHSWKLARKEWQGAATEIREIISDVPSQIPHPDGSLRIERAAMNRDGAYNRYKEAFHRYRHALRSCVVREGPPES